MASSKQRNITVKPGHLLHVETPLGIINIRAGLTDDVGRDVDAIELIADATPPKGGCISADFPGNRFVRYASARHFAEEGPGFAKLLDARDALNEIIRLMYGDESPAAAWRLRSASLGPDIEAVLIRHGFRKEET